MGRYGSMQTQDYSDHTSAQTNYIMRPSAILGSVFEGPISAPILGPLLGPIPASMDPYEVWANAFSYHIHTQQKC